MSIRVLVFGGSGMLGHKLVQRLSHRFEVWTTIRGSCSPRLNEAIGLGARVVPNVDVCDLDRLVQTVSTIRPTVIVNAAGLVKQRPDSNEAIQALQVNALFPLRLARVCQMVGSKLIHISTDCVFSGMVGNYKETDFTDAQDLYGRTKALGEPLSGDVLTVRTSIIGRELSATQGLVEWFLSQSSSVYGYGKSIFSGVTTIALSDIVADVIERHPELSGLYHLSSSPITKYNVLLLLKQAFARTIDVIESEGVEVNRSLDSTRFREATGIVPPSWPAMVATLAHDGASYEHWRRSSDA